MIEVTRTETGIHKTKLSLFFKDVKRWGEVSEPSSINCEVATWILCDDLQEIVIEIDYDMFDRLMDKYKAFPKLN